MTDTQKQALADSKATYAEYTKQTQLESIPALPSAPPTGKRLTFVTCNIPVCKTASDGAVEAGEKLGWEVTVLQDDSTPQSYISVMNQVAADPPDALAYIPAVPDSSIEKQLSELQAAGTIIIELSPLGDVLKEGGPVQAVVMGQKDTALSGKLMGDAIVADANGPTDAVFVWDPSFVDGWGPIKESFESSVEGAGGKVGVLEASVAGIGKTVPSQIVSYLQAHPETKYVALAVVNYNAGLNEDSPGRRVARQSQGHQSRSRFGNAQVDQGRPGVGVGGARSLHPVRSALWTRSFGS